ncbi:hypothetical protein [Bacillus sp. AK128]
MKNLKEQYLTEVIHFIKLKEAKEVVHNELSYHLEMSKNELVSKGENALEFQEHLHHLQSHLAYL